MFIPKTSPRNALACYGLSSLPSEEKAAYLCDLMAHLINKGDVPAVAFRYSQIKSGEDNAFMTAASSAVIFLAIALCILSDLNLLSEQKSLFLFFALIEVVSSAFFFPSFGNYRSYNQAKDACEEWLNKATNESFVNSLREVGYDHVGFFSIKNLLTKHHFSNDINANVLPKQFKTIAGKAQ